MIEKRFFKTKDEVEVTFVFAREDVKKAELLLDYEGWQAISMKKRRKDNAFVTKVRLPKNEQFQFRYRLNGSEWENDYAADAYWPNEYGADNSVVFTSKN